MARPESKGGVVVVLLRPHSTQDNSDGFLAGKYRCPTVDAVSELISVVSNTTLGFDDISVFDAIPFLDEKVKGEEIIEQAQDVFANMIKAKQPEVVISCFQTETNNPIVKNLRCRRIGYSFEFDLQGSKQLAELGLPSTRVNALHPSYAINYNPEFSCFKRLLILEFVKAFALWRRQRWADERWMSDLRHECHEQAKKLAEGISASVHFNAILTKFYLSPRLLQSLESTLSQRAMGESSCGFGIRFRGMLFQQVWLWLG